MKKTISTTQPIATAAFILLFLSFMPYARTQTTLAAGDIAITGYKGFGPSASVDEFSFVLLKSIATNTVINFTDRGWLRTGPSTGSFSAIETTGITWTSNANYAAGVEIKIVGTTATYAYLTGGSPLTGGAAGAVTGTALSLSANGDQVIAYQGTIASPSFIAAIHMNVYTNSIAAEPTTTDAIWDGSYDTANASGIPTGLTSGVNALWIGTQGDINSEKDNAYFVCVGNLTTISSIKALIYDKTKWTTSDGDPGGFSLPTNCNYLSSNPLPVEITAFQGKNTEGGDVLTWQTASEKNNAYFDIESGNDGVNFVKIGQVKGIGTSQKPQDYTFLNDKTMNGVNYYRLKQVDANGEFSYSKTVSVMVSKGGKMVVYPSNTEGVVFVNNDHATVQNIAIFNAVGQLVLTQKAASITYSIIKLDLSAFPTGLYVLSIKTNDGLVSEKVFKR